MKIRIAFICPYGNMGIGGGDRKLGIYHKNLDEAYFEKYMIFLSQKSGEIPPQKNTLVLREEELSDFLKKHHISYAYITVGLISPEREKELLEHTIGIYNINFTPIYRNHPRILNFAISITEYWKLHWIHNSLSNTFVTYNPIDFDNWTRLAKNAQGRYRDSFKGKKYIIGRIARAEPSKWHFLIVATLFTLDRKKNYQYGFLFAGMPWLYRKILSLFGSKELKQCIVCLPELREYTDIAEFYKSIDIFWQTSWIGESFGNVIAEAFCFEVPVITDYKFFYRNGHVKKELYDTQIELVDHMKNGVYAAYPETIIGFLGSTDPKSLKTLGKAGYKKAQDEYNIKHTSLSIAKILYEYGRQHLGFLSDPSFELLPQIPDTKAIEGYQDEYRKRIAICLQFNKISSLEKIQYSLFERAWRLLEYGYLILRKFMLKIASYDIEKTN